MGPRDAQVHVGGGRTSVSTRAGPFTHYQSSTGSRRFLGPSYTGLSTTQIAGAAKLEQARLTMLVLEGISNIHRQVFTQSVQPTAVPPALPPFQQLLGVAEAEQLRGIGLFRRTARSVAKGRARVRAEAQAQELMAAAAAVQQQAQVEIDEYWRALESNQPGAVLGMLAVAFEDNDAPVAAIGLEGAEVSLVVLVPTPEIVPERLPVTTEAGNLSLRRMTKAQRAAWYRAVVAGQAVVSVKEVFAIAPGVQTCSIVALRSERRDVFSKAIATPILCTRLSRKDLEGVQWSTADAWELLVEAGADTVISLRGAAQELAPLDLTDQPDLMRLVDAVDLYDPDYSRSSSGTGLSWGSGRATHQ